VSITVFLRVLAVFAVLFTFQLPSVSIAQTGEVPSESTQIRNTVLALPEAVRDSATVMGYTNDLELVTLREGWNGLICIADHPGDERYSAVCYHESIDPFISRGRELREEGVEDAEVYKIRHDEMDAGTLPLPDAGAVLYNMTMPLADFDPTTAGPALYSIYTPYATAASTGLPDRPAGPGTPWIMRGGTPSAHVMIIAPKPAEEKEGGY
jgi:hypothetical protein